MPLTASRLIPHCNVICLRIFPAHCALRSFISETVVFISECRELSVLLNTDGCPWPNHWSHKAWESLMCLSGSHNDHVCYSAESMEGNLSLGQGSTGLFLASSDLFVGNHPPCFLWAGLLYLLPPWKSPLCLSVLVKENSRLPGVGSFPELPRNPCSSAMQNVIFGSVHFLCSILFLFVVIYS